MANVQEEENSENIIIYTLRNLHWPIYRAVTFVLSYVDGVAVDCLSYLADVRPPPSPPPVQAAKVTRHPEVRRPPLRKQAPIESQVKPTDKDIYEHFYSYTTLIASWLVVLILLSVIFARCWRRRRAAETNTIGFNGTQLYPTTTTASPDKCKRSPDKSIKSAEKCIVNVAKSYSTSSSHMTEGESVAELTKIIQDLPPAPKTRGLCKIRANLTSNGNRSCKTTNPKLLAHCACRKIVPKLQQQSKRGYTYASPKRKARELTKVVNNLLTNEDPNAFKTKWNGGIRSIKRKTCDMKHQQKRLRSFSSFKLNNVQDKSAKKRVQSSPCRKRIPLTDKSSQSTCSSQLSSTASRRKSNTVDRKLAKTSKVLKTANISSDMKHIKSNGQQEGHRIKTHTPANLLNRERVRRLLKRSPKKIKKPKRNISGQKAMKKMRKKLKTVGKLDTKSMTCGKRNLSNANKTPPCGHYLRVPESCRGLQNSGQFSEEESTDPSTSSRIKRRVVKLGTKARTCGRSSLANVNKTPPPGHYLHVPEPCRGLQNIGQMSEEESTDPSTSSRIKRTATPVLNSLLGQGAFTTCWPQNANKTIQTAQEPSENRNTGRHNITFLGNRFQDSNNDTSVTVNSCKPNNNNTSYNIFRKVENTDKPKAPSTTNMERIISRKNDYVRVENVTLSGAGTHLVRHFFSSQNKKNADYVCSSLNVGGTNTHERIQKPRETEGLLRVPSSDTASKKSQLSRSRTMPSSYPKPIKDVVKNTKYLCSKQIDTQTQLLDNEHSRSHTVQDLKNLRPVDNRQSEHMRREGILVHKFRARSKSLAQINETSTKVSRGNGWKLNYEQNSSLIPSFSTSVNRQEDSLLTTSKDAAHDERQQRVCQKIVHKRGEFLNPAVQQLNASKSEHFEAGRETTRIKKASVTKEGNVFRVTRNNLPFFPEVYAQQSHLWQQPLNAQARQGLHSNKSELPVPANVFNVSGSSTATRYFHECHNTTVSDMTVRYFPSRCETKTDGIQSLNQNALQTDNSVSTKTGGELVRRNEHNPFLHAHTAEEENTETFTTSCLNEDQNEDHEVQQYTAAYEFQCHQEMNQSNSSSSFIDEEYDAAKVGTHQGKIPRLETLDLAHTGTIFRQHGTVETVPSHSGSRGYALTTGSLSNSYNKCRKQQKTFGQTLNNRKISPTMNSSHMKVLSRHKVKRKKSLISLKNMLSELTSHVRASHNIQKSEHEMNHKEKQSNLVNHANKPETCEFQTSFSQVSNPKSLPIYKSNDKKDNCLECNTQEGSCQYIKCYKARNLKCLRHEPYKKRISTSSESSFTAPPSFDLCYIRNKNNCSPSRRGRYVLGPLVDNHCFGDEAPIEEEDTDDSDPTIVQDINPPNIESSVRQTGEVTSTRVATTENVRPAPTVDVIRHTASIGGHALDAISHTASIGKPALGALSNTASIGRPALGALSNTASIARPALGALSHTASIGVPVLDVISHTPSIGGPALDPISHTASIGRPALGAKSHKDFTGGFSELGEQGIRGTSQAVTQHPPSRYKESHKVLPERTDNHGIQKGKPKTRYNSSDHQEINIAIDSSIMEPTISRHVTMLQSIDDLENATEHEEGDNSDVQVITPHTRANHDNTENADHYITRYVEKTQTITGHGNTSHKSRKFQGLTSENELQHSEERDTRCRLVGVHAGNHTHIDKVVTADPVLKQKTFIKLAVPLTTAEDITAEHSVHKTPAKMSAPINLNNTSSGHPKRGREQLPVGYTTPGNKPAENKHVGTTFMGLVTIGGGGRLDYLSTEGKAPKNVSVSAAEYTSTGEVADILGYTAIKHAATQSNTKEIANNRSPTFRLDVQVATSKQAASVETQTEPYSPAYEIARTHLAAAIRHVDHRGSARRNATHPLQGHFTTERHGHSQQITAESENLTVACSRIESQQTDAQQAPNEHTLSRPANKQKKTIWPALSGHTSATHGSTRNIISEYKTTEHESGERTVANNVPENQTENVTRNPAISKEVTEKKPARETHVFQCATESINVKHQENQHSTRQKYCNQINASFHPIEEKSPANAFQKQIAARKITIPRKHGHKINREINQVDTSPESRHDQTDEEQFDFQFDKRQQTVKNKSNIISKPKIEHKLSFKYVRETSEESAVDETPREPHCRETRIDLRGMQAYERVTRSPGRLNVTLGSDKMELSAVISHTDQNAKGSSNFYNRKQKQSNLSEKRQQIKIVAEARGAKKNSTRRSILEDVVSKSKGTTRIKALRTSQVRLALVKNDAVLPRLRGRRKSLTFRIPSPLDGEPDRPVVKVKHRGKSLTSGHHTPGAPGGGEKTGLPPPITMSHMTQTDSSVNSTHVAVQTSPRLNMAARRSHYLKVKKQLITPKVYRKKRRLKQQIVSTLRHNQRSLGSNITSLLEACHLPTYVWSCVYRDAQPQNETYINNGHHQETLNQETDLQMSVLADSFDKHNFPEIEQPEVLPQEPYLETLHEESSCQILHHSARYEQLSCPRGIIESCDEERNETDPSYMSNRVALKSREPEQHCTEKTVGGIRLPCRSLATERDALEQASQFISKSVDDDNSDDIPTEKPNHRSSNSSVVTNEFRKLDTSDALDRSGVNGQPYISDTYEKTDDSSEMAYTNETRRKQLYGQEFIFRHYSSKAENSDPRSSNGLPTTSATPSTTVESSSRMGETSESSIVSTRLSELRKLCVIHPVWKNANVEEIDRRVKRALKLREMLKRKNLSGGKVQCFIKSYAESSVPETIVTTPEYTADGACSALVSESTNKEISLLSAGDESTPMPVEDSGDTLSPKVKQLPVRDQESSSLKSSITQQEQMKDSKFHGNSANNVSTTPPFCWTSTENRTSGFTSSDNKRSGRAFTFRKLDEKDWNSQTEHTSSPHEDNTSVVASRPEIHSTEPESSHVSYSNSNSGISMKRAGVRVKNSPPTKISKVENATMTALPRLVGCLVQKLPQVPLSSFVEWFIETSDPNNFISPEMSSSSAENSPSNSNTYCSKGDNTDVRENSTTWRERDRNETSKQKVFLDRTKPKHIGHPCLGRSTSFRESAPSCQHEGPKVIVAVESSEGHNADISSDIWRSGLQRSSSMPDSSRPSSTVQKISSLSVETEKDSVLKVNSETPNQNFMTPSDSVIGKTDKWTFSFKSTGGERSNKVVNYTHNKTRLNKSANLASRRRNSRQRLAFMRDSFEPITSSTDRLYDESLEDLTLANSSESTRLQTDRVTTRPELDSDSGVNFGQQSKMTIRGRKDASLVTNKTIGQSLSEFDPGRGSTTEQAEVLVWRENVSPGRVTDSEHPRVSECTAETEHTVHAETTTDVRCSLQEVDDNQGCSKDNRCGPGIRHIIMKLQQATDFDEANNFKGKRTKTKLKNSANLSGIISKFQNDH